MFVIVICIQKALRADPPKGTGMMHVASSASLMHDGRVGVSVIVSVIVIVTVTLGIADRPRRPSAPPRARAQMSLSFFDLLVRHLVVHSCGLHCGDRARCVFVARAATARNLVVRRCIS